MTGHGGVTLEKNFQFVQNVIHSSKQASTWTTLEAHGFDFRRLPFLPLSVFLFISVGMYLSFCVRQLSYFSSAERGNFYIFSAFLLTELAAWPLPMQNVTISLDL